MIFYYFLLLITSQISCNEEEIKIVVFDQDFTPIEQNLSAVENDLKLGYLSLSIFKNYTQLPILQLTNLQISVIDNNDFIIDSLVDLRVINSKFRPILTREFFGICPNLQHLTLINNQITFTRDALSTLTSLKSLIIRQQDYQIDFSHLPTLEILTITDSDYSVVRIDDFRKLLNLKQLILCRNGIFQIEDGSFVHLENLEFLNLDRNQIRVFPWNDLEYLNKLETLIISNNLLTTIDYQLYLSSLRNLDISHNLIDSQQLELITTRILKRNQNLVLIVDSNRTVMLIGGFNLITICVCVLSMQFLEFF